MSGHKEIETYYTFLLNALIINPNLEILCLTGTPKIGKDYNFLYELVPISYEKKVDSAIEEGLLNDYMIHIFNYEYKDKELSNYLYWKNKYDIYVNSGRKDFGFEMQKLKRVLGNSQSKVNLGKYLLKEKLFDKKVLVYAGSIDQSEKLEIPSFHSKLKKEEKIIIYDNFYNDINLHLANVGGLRESVSIPYLTHGLFLNIDASYTITEQSIR